MSEYWKGRKVLVTGADGFAGSRLVEILTEKGAVTRAFVRTGPLRNIKEGKAYEVHCGDVQDYPSISSACKGIDTLFHAAAITLIPETRSLVMNTLSTNSLGTLNVLMAALERKVKKIVYISTCHVYGKQSRLPITEDHIPFPIDIYSASKLAGEHICTAFVEMYDQDISISRAFNHFGPRQRQEFIIPKTIIGLLKGKVTLGDSTPTRDFSYIDDILQGYLLLAEKGRPKEIYQFCSGVERSIAEIVEAIKKVGGFHDSTIEWNPGARKVDLDRSVGDYSKAKRELGWEPRISFEKALEKTIEWYRNNPQT